MTKQSANRGGSGSRGSSARPSSRQGGTAGNSSRSSSNSRMWSQPATPRQLAALKANGNDDGKYYSKGRAGQTIGASVRSAGTPTQRAISRGRSPLPALSPPDTQLVATSAAERAPVSAEIVATTPAIQTIFSTCPTPVAEGSFGFQEFLALLDELEQRQLRQRQAQYGAYSGHPLRTDIKAWNSFRLTIINTWAGAHAALTAILSRAPLGSIPDPAATASGLLDAAYPHAFEERQLRQRQAQYGAYSGDLLRGDIKSWLTTRIELATTNAQELVRLLNEQAMLASVTQPRALPAPPSGTRSATTTPREQRARPKPRPKRTTPAGKGRAHTGTVTSINPHGAVVSLDSGEQGWLHVSHLRQLNGGAWVESVSDVLRVGQELRVRSIGTTHRGQAKLTLAEARANKPTENNTTTATTESRDDMPPAGAESRHGGRKWFGFGRNEKAGT